eukprot:m.638660 g.638660  ORF g.638660 m.638660 type:complete len:296 (-) comp58328_c0_seq17:865-1752(-)
MQPDRTRSTLSFFHSILYVVEDQLGIEPPSCRITEGRLFQILLVLLAISGAVPPRSALTNLADFNFHYRAVISIVSVVIEALTVSHPVRRARDELLFLVAVISALFSVTRLKASPSLQSDDVVWAIWGAQLLVVGILAWFLARKVITTLPGNSTASATSEGKLSGHSTSTTNESDALFSDPEDPDISFKRPDVVKAFASADFTPRGSRRAGFRPTKSKLSQQQEESTQSSEPKEDTDRESSETESEVEGPALPDLIQNESVPRLLHVYSPGRKMPGFGVVETRLRSRSTRNTASL